MNRKTHWEGVYRDKSPLNVSWYQREPSQSLDLIGRSVANTTAAIIDVGGGASLLVDRLLDLGYQHVSVLDISARALAHARARLAERADQVEWIESDITLFRPAHRYALWHDRAVFHFLTDANDRMAYVDTLRRSLLSGGHAIIAAFAIGGPTQCSGLDIVQYDAAKLMRELGAGFELLEERSELHITPAGKEQKFSYFRCRYLP